MMIHDDTTATADSINEYSRYRPSGTQQGVISSLQIPPSILSLIGSSLILYSIRKAQKRTPHRRIMFALSVCNLIATLGYLLEPFLVPISDAPDSWVFAVGNDASCVMLGAISQFGIITQPMYLGFLSMYFLLTVKFGIRQRDFEAKYERRVHGFILTLAISTALAGILLGYFRPNMVSPGCWINPPSATCENGHCREKLFALIFGAVPAITSLLAILISNGMLYVHVRNRVVEGQKKTMSHEKKLIEFSSSLRNLEIPDSADGHPDELSSKGDSNSDDAGVPSIEYRRRMFATKSVSSSSLSAMSTMSQVNGNVLRSTKKQWKRVRQVGRQALLYVGAFLLTFSWPFAIYYLTSHDFGHREGSGTVLFILSVFQALFLPSLGLINSIIFILPKYKSARKKFEYEPWWWILEQVLTGEAEKVERFSSISNFSCTTKGERRKSHGDKSLMKKLELLSGDLMPSSTTMTPNASEGIDIIKSTENKSVDNFSIDDILMEEEDGFQSERTEVLVHHHRHNTVGFGSF